jgi:Fe-S cluster assembly ATP-binding protein
MESKLLKINDLKTRVGETEILKGLNLEIGKGEVHAIMGPNGAGKSTLVNTIMGHPKYSISSGDILFEGKSINEMKVDERARLGIFMSFQYPEEIQGITVENFLRTAKSAITGKKIGILKFRRQLKEKLNLLKIDESYSKRYLNVGFSGGEKKKNEILQMAVLEPKLAMLDETDSGLDVDAVRIVSEGVNHSSILEYLKPDYVHILVNGKIVKTGDASLAEEIEKNGYDAFKALA